MGALSAFGPAGRLRAYDKTPRNRNTVARRLAAALRMAREASLRAHHIPARANGLVTLSVLASGPPSGHRSVHRFAASLISAFGRSPHALGSYREVFASLSFASIFEV